jgi:diguanylate cyclase (GGDEF)-like protein/PAS domain S-box-containing protein
MGAPSRLRHLPTLAHLAAGATLAATGYVLSSPNLSMSQWLVPGALTLVALACWRAGDHRRADARPEVPDATPLVISPTTAPQASAPSTRSTKTLGLLGAAFEQSSQAIVLTDALDRVVQVNPAFEAMSGRAALDMLGQPAELLGLTPLRATHLAGIDTALREVNRWSGESAVIGADGQAHDLWLNVSTIRDAEHRISHHFRVFQDVEPLKAQLRQMAEQARHDSLTGLPNRRAFGEQLFQAMARTRRYPKTLSIMCVDLDGFKAVNDTHGHQVGDQLLVQVARRLEACVRTTDSVCRIGGDEFMLILEGAGNLDEINRIGQRVLRCLTELYAIAGCHLHVTPSIGAVVHDGQESDAALVQRADAAMYAAKNAGKCRMVLADSQDMRVDAQAA